MKSSDVVVVTGASAGVGRATVIEFAKRCCKIALLARGQQGLLGAERDVIAHGGEAMIIPVDVSDPEQVEMAAEKVVKTWGRIDIWINCAMTTVFSEFMDITSEDYRRVTDVTYLGYVYGTNAALKRMIPSDRGTVVQVGSSLCYRGIPLQSAYCGAKHAIKGFTESLRCELLHRKSNVHLTMVHLPAVNTPQFQWSKNNMQRNHQPVPPIYQPEICAEAIHWAAYHKRRELLIGFTTEKVIWLNKFFPGIIDLYLSKTGYESQLYNGSPTEGKPDNLWQPVDKDYGARGIFDDRSSTKSLQVTVTKTPFLPAIVSILTLLLYHACTRNRSRQPRS